MPLPDAYDLPLLVTSFKGFVLIQGPAGSGAVTLTPEAALESAALLLAAAQRACSDGAPVLPLDD